MPEDDDELYFDPETEDELDLFKKFPNHNLKALVDCGCVGMTERSMRNAFELGEGSYSFWLLPITKEKARSMGVVV